MSRATLLAVTLPSNVSNASTVGNTNIVAASCRIRLPSSTSCVNATVSTGGSVSRTTTVRGVADAAFPLLSLTDSVYTAVYVPRTFTSTPDVSTTSRLLSSMPSTLSSTVASRV